MGARSKDNIVVSEDTGCSVTFTEWNMKFLYSFSYWQVDLYYAWILLLLLIRTSQWMKEKHSLLGGKRIKRHQKAAIMINTLICKILVSQSGHPQRKEHLFYSHPSKGEQCLGLGQKQTVLMAGGRQIVRLDPWGNRPPQPRHCWAENVFTPILWLFSNLEVDIHITLKKKSKPLQRSSGFLRSQTK